MKPEPSEEAIEAARVSASIAIGTPKVLPSRRQVIATLRAAYRLDWDELGRQWAIANASGYKDERTCAHESLVQDITCVQCAHELGRREGQA